MIQSISDGYPSLVAARPLAVILKSGRLNLSTLPDALPFQVVEAETWEELVLRLSRFRAGCALLDFDEDRDEKAGKLTTLLNSGVPLTVIGCCADPTPQVVHRAIRSGCYEVIQNPLSHHTLSQVFSRAVEHDASGVDSPCEVRSRLSTLTPREREIMEMFLDGANTKLIAKRLSVTKQTVDKHRKNACEKMQAPNFTRVACQLYRR